MSIYDPLYLGPAVFEPAGIYSDYVQVSLSSQAVAGLEDPPQPYIQDGSLYIPVIVWERMQSCS